VSPSQLILILALASLLWALLFSTVTALIWESKGGRFVAGFLLGFFLSVLGLVYVVAARPNPERLGADWRSCPHCAEPMREYASACPHCGGRSSPPVQ
jgi:hypothetical protein